MRYQLYGTLVKPTTLTRFFAVGEVIFTYCAACGRPTGVRSRRYRLMACTPPRHLKRSARRFVPLPRQMSSARSQESAPARIEWIRLPLQHGGCEDAEASLWLPLRGDIDSLRRMRIWYERVWQCGHLRALSGPTSGVLSTLPARWPVSPPAARSGSWKQAQPRTRALPVPLNPALGDLTVSHTTGQPPPDPAGRGRVAGSLGSGYAVRGPA